MEPGEQHPVEYAPELENQNEDGERVRVFVGWYGMDYSRPEEPNVFVERLEYPYYATDYLADPDDPAVDDNHPREITCDDELASWAEEEFEWWDIRTL